MVKKDTRKKIVNPRTGRKVLASGSVGTKIKKKPTKKAVKTKAVKTKSTVKRKTTKSTAKKKVTKSAAKKKVTKSAAKKITKSAAKKKVTKSAPKRAKNKSQSKKKQVKKTTVKPSKKVQDSRSLANFINRIEGKKVMKVTKKGNVRLSAAQAFRDGTKLGTPHCYDGKCKYLREDKNKRRFWSTR